MRFFISPNNTAYTVAGCLYDMPAKHKAYDAKVLAAGN